MDKIIDFRKAVYRLVAEYPELKEIMVSVGFEGITEPEILTSTGKVMTVLKGSQMKGIPIGKTVKASGEKGSQVSGVDGAPVPPMPPTTSVKPSVPPIAQYDSLNTKPERAETLRNYLTRLSQDESLDMVREDFRREFYPVEVSEIMQTEQQLMKDGVPLEEVQKLCDIHSALLHEATKEERIVNVEREATASMIRVADHRKAGQQTQYGGKNALVAKLTAVPGHPLETLTQEDQALSRRIKSFRNAAKLNVSLKDAAHVIRKVTVHYAKKDNLLHPLLKVEYGVTGPSSVMRTMGDEICDELGHLNRAKIEDDVWETVAEAVMQRADEMIYKEVNILFPIYIVNFTEDEWEQIYRGPKDYENCLSVVSRVYRTAEEDKPAAKEKEVQVAVDTTETERRSSSFVGEIVIPGGHLKLGQLGWLLSTIPVEIAFVDADNIDRYFNGNEGQKAFKHPKMALNHEVFPCHPPKAGPLVRQIIGESRAGQQSSISIWAEKGGRTMPVNYRAVRDVEDNYLDTTEFVQDMEFAKRYFQQGGEKQND